MLDGDAAPPRKRVLQPPVLGPCQLWPNRRPSQQLLSSCFYLANPVFRSFRRLRPCYTQRRVSICRSCAARGRGHLLTRACCWPTADRRLDRLTRLTGHSAVADRQPRCRQQLRQSISNMPTSRTSPTANPCLYYIIT